MARRVKGGDDRPLQRYRWWQLFSRSLFHLHLIGADGVPKTWSVDVRHGGDSNGEVFARLYLNGRNRARSKMPAAFPVTGGTIEVQASMYGLRGCHYVPVSGPEQQLVPDPASTEGLRAYLDRARPTLSRAIGVVSTTILAVALVLAVPQLVEQISQIPPVAENVGVFVSPIHLPPWANISLLVASVIASTERALRLRYNRFLDGGLSDAGE